MSGGIALERGHTRADRREHTGKWLDDAVKRLCRNCLSQGSHESRLTMANPAKTDLRIRSVQLPEFAHCMY